MRTVGLTGGLPGKVKELEKAFLVCPLSLGNETMPLLRLKCQRDITQVIKGHVLRGQS